MTERWTKAQIMERSARGLGKVDFWQSPRGASVVTTDEIEAMAAALALFGLRAIHPEPVETAPVKAPLTPLLGPADD